MVGGCAFRIVGPWLSDTWSSRSVDAAWVFVHDLEVVVRRRDQQSVHAALVADWELFALDPPGGGWRPWRGLPIGASAFQLQARSSSIEFDLFTETSDGSHWHFRRDNRITRGCDEVIVRSESGIPIVRPEIQLLYMAKSTEPKNQSDFEMAGPHLPPEAAAWLKHALQVTHPGHRWLHALS